MTTTSQADIQQWFINQISEELDIEHNEIDPDLPIANFGVDSITMVGIATAMENAFSIEVDPASFYKYPTINKISEFIFQELND